MLAVLNKNNTSIAQADARWMKSDRDCLRPTKFEGLNNEKGQMAIFVALIFNVLFVIFAMAINVAMVVHDKINLQNSVDLAAYYAAQRQAEWLNAIAHQNYQIRQAFKLLTWRYRVMGTVSHDQRAASTEWGDLRHPSYLGMGEDSPYYPPPMGVATDLHPAVCVADKAIFKGAPEDNLCNKPKLKITPLGTYNILAPFNPINAPLAFLNQQLKRNYGKRCEDSSQINFWFAGSIHTAFREEQKARKLAIRSMAANMSRPFNQMLDIRGDSVQQGIRNTLFKNLTFSNQGGFEEENLQVFNSIQGTAGGNTSFQTVKWLAEIPAYITLIYAHGKTADNGGCTFDTQYINDTIPTGGIIDSWDATGKIRAMVKNDVPINSEEFFITGVEKNPWYMVYSAVRAVTVSRPLFMPFSSGITLQARAYAKPFGGRIGPWYARRWPPGNAQSAGGESSTERVDPLMPPRTDANGFLMGNPFDPTRLPNYSRFPGDQLGLNSRLSHTAISGLANKLKVVGSQVDYNFFRHLIYSNQQEVVDRMAMDRITGVPPAYRKFEHAAILPDAFDVTYYSIEPNFEDNYRQVILQNIAKFDFLTDRTIPPDIGGSNFFQDFKKFNIENQYDQVLSLGPWNATISPNVYYLVDNVTKLLTSWAPNQGAYDYSFPTELFGQCQSPDKNIVKQPRQRVPGSCIAGGGRTGYSVKLVSQRALLSQNYDIGNDASSGIINPPPW